MPGQSASDDDDDDDDDSGDEALRNFIFNVQMRHTSTFTPVS